MVKTYTIDEAMAALRCSRTFVYKLMSAGELSRRKIGSKVFIPGEDVDRLLSEGTSPSFPSNR